MNQLQNILFKLRRYFLLKFHKKQWRDKKYLSFDNISSVALLYYIDDYSKYEIVYKNIKDFTAMGKTVFSVLFVKKGVLAEEKRINMLLFTQNDCSWLCVPNDNIMLDALNMAADILIDISLMDSIPLQYIVANSQVGCKVAMKKENKFLYDLMIEMKEEQVNEDKLLETIAFYLKQIKS